MGANQKLGVKSTLKPDLSQYTTELDLNRVPAAVKQRAARLANEIEKGSASKDMDEGGCYSDDEEMLFSAVPRSTGSRARGGGGYNGGPIATGGEDGGAGGALLATLRAAPAVSRGEDDYYTLVAPKVRGWWHAQRQAGVAVPPGSEDQLVCPLSREVFGDVTQLVTYWAAILPKAANNATTVDTANTASETPGSDSRGDAVAEQFRRVAHEVRWSQMAATAGLDAMLPVDAPRQGSVWAEILARLGRPSRGSEPLASRLVSDFVSEAVQMKCWQRDKKVEHRKLLEALAAGLALHLLASERGPQSPPK